MVTLTRCWNKIVLMFYEVAQLIFFLNWIFFLQEKKSKKTEVVKKNGYPQYQVKEAAVNNLAHSTKQKLIFSLTKCVSLLLRIDQTFWQLRTDLFNKVKIYNIWLQWVSIDKPMIVQLLLAHFIFPGVVQFPAWRDRTREPRCQGQLRSEARFPGKRYVTI